MFDLGPTSVRARPKPVRTRTTAVRTPPTSVRHRPKCVRSLPNICSSSTHICPRSTQTCENSMLGFGRKSPTGVAPRGGLRHATPGPPRRPNFVISGSPHPTISNWFPPRGKVKRRTNLNMCKLEQFRAAPNPTAMAKGATSPSEHGAQPVPFGVVPAVHLPQPWVCRGGTLHPETRKTRGEHTQPLTFLIRGASNMPRTYH